MNAKYNFAIINYFKIDPFSELIQCVQTIMQNFFNIGAEGGTSQKSKCLKTSPSRSRFKYCLIFKTH